MDGALKKGVVVLVVLFLGWLLLTDPTRMADLAKNGGSALWDGLVAVFEAVGRFLDEILG